MKTIKIVRVDSENSAFEISQYFDKTKNFPFLFKQSIWIIAFDFETQLRNMPEVISFRLIEY